MRRFIEWIHKGQVQSLIALVGVLVAIATLVITVKIGEDATSPPGLRVDGIDELLGISERQLDAQEGLLAASAPQDEIEALNRRGYGLDRESFHRAMRSGDVKSIGLFCNAEISPMVDSYFFFDHYPMTEKVASMLSRCNAVDIEELCKLEEGTGQLGIPRFTFKEDIAVSICGADSYRQAQARYEADYDEWTRSGRDHCSDLNQRFAKMDDTMGDRSTFNMHVRLQGWMCEEVGVPLKFR